MSEEKKMTPQEYFKDFPEAPFSDSFKWVDDKGFEHLSTARSWSWQSLLQSTEQFIDGITEIGGKPPKENRAPATQVQERTEDGTPVIDGDGKPVMKSLPDGINLYTVKQVFHGKTQNGKDYLGVTTEEKPHNRKWGVKCFHPGDVVPGWKQWPIGAETPTYYAPPESAKKVVIREATGEGTYPEVMEFRAEAADGK